MARLRNVLADGSVDAEVDLDTCRARVGMWINQIRLEDFRCVFLLSKASYICDRATKYRLHH